MKRKLHGPAEKSGRRTSGRMRTKNRKRGRRKQMLRSYELSSSAERSWRVCMTSSFLKVGGLMELVCFMLQVLVRVPNGS
jgi:hypothetical protein